MAIEVNEREGKIYTASGLPFESEKAAQLRSGVLKREGIYTTIHEEVDGSGWTLIREQVDPDIENMPRRRYKFWEQPNELFIKEEDKDPRFEYRVVNDNDTFWRNRVNRLHKAGWDIVKQRVQMNDGVGANQIGGSVSKQPVGRNVSGVLMRKPKKWYREDYAEKQKANDEIMSQIKDAATGRVDGGAQPIPVQDQARLGIGLDVEATVGSAP